MLLFFSLCFHWYSHAFSFYCYLIWVVSVFFVCTSAPLKMRVLPQCVFWGFLIKERIYLIFCIKQKSCSENINILLWFLFRCFQLGRISKGIVCYAGSTRMFPSGMSSWMKIDLFLLDFECIWSNWVRIYRTVVLDKIIVSTIYFIF